MIMFAIVREDKGLGADEIFDKLLLRPMLHGSNELGDSTQREGTKASHFCPLKGAISSPDYKCFFSSINILIKSLEFPSLSLSLMAIN